jgi:opacity protein-like surface antigen
MSMKLALLVCAFAMGSVAQPVSVGLKGGVPITDALETFRGNQSAYFTSTHRYLVGPTVQLNFPFRFSVEVDALYRRLGYEYNQFAGPGSPTSTRTVANSWEFPVLGKYAIWGGPLRPFVDAGANFRHISGVDQIRSTLTAVNVNVTAPEFNDSSDIGFVFGGGVEIKLGFIRITPELRYTRWGSENFRDPVASLLRTNKNQGDFILGLTF